MIRRYVDDDFDDVINIAYRHLGSDYAEAISRNIDSSEIWVVDTNLGIRSFILYKKENVFDILAFTDMFNEFTVSSYRKFREIIQNRGNTIVIHFTRNKDILERAILPYGGYVVYNFIIVPKKEVE